MATKLPPIPSPPGTAFREFRITVLPFLMFGLVLVVTAYLWTGYVGPSTLVGEVASNRAIVSCPHPGRVVQLRVGHLQKVLAGQALVQILTADPKVLEAQLALSKAKIEYVRASSETGLRKENNLLSYQKLRLDWMKERANLAIAKARMIYHESEFARAKHYNSVRAPIATQVPPIEGVITNLISTAEFQEALGNLNMSRAEVEELGRLVADLETVMKEFNQDRADEDQEPDTVRTAVAVEERQLGLIEVQLAPMMLVAPMDGFVSIVHRHTGESVVPGEPILTISQASSERIVAFLRQPLGMQPTTNQLVEVRSRSAGRTSGLGQVLAVGAQLEPIYPQLLPSRAQGNTTAEYGLPILVSVPNGMHLFGGEIVDLRPIP